jgi:LmbE family N-acetylglucosaminyl deacetylase
MLPIRFGPEPHAPLTILCIGAHCDDIEIGCGATILRLLAEHPGSSVYWVVLAGNPRRADEARSAAKAFLEGAGHATVEVKTFRESYFPYVGAEIKDYFETLSKATDPHLIFTHYHLDRHQDHRVASELTWNTFRNHLIAEYEIPKYEGDLDRPNTYVALTRAHADRKVDLLMQQFPSQASRHWFRAETFHSLMIVRGNEAVAAEGRAEAFHVRKLVL